VTNLGDNPIQRIDEDRLERRAGAISVAADIRELDATRGYVVGIIGPWGSGKTSLVNMIREQLEAEPAIPIIEFNPWMFSGTHELVESFFREVSAQMRLKEPRIAAIAEVVDTYGELLSPASALPFVGAWIDRVRGSAKALKAYQERRKGSITQQRHKLSVALAELTVPVVITIDDIDRLESSEIRDIFKLVRLTANFPNVVYMLAFDRSRVEAALSESGFDGRAYLEKIVQLPVDVPVLPNSLLLRLLGESLNEAVQGLDATDRFNADAWPDVLMEIVRPLLSNLRDISRYSGAVRAKARALGSQIELVDLLGLEAIRVFAPDLFAAMVAGREALTTPSASFGTGSEDPELKVQVEAILQIGEPYPGVVRAAVSRLFPAGGRHIGASHYGADWLPLWLKSRRVAHPDIFALYLENFSNEGLEAFDAAERAFYVLDNQTALDALLRSYGLDRVQDIVAALEAFEAEFPAEAVVPVSTVLLNILPELPERPGGMLGFVNARLIVARVILRLFRRLDSPLTAMQAVQDVLQGVSSLSSQLELITLVGHREGAGHELVSEADAKQLEKALQREIQEAPPERLAEETDILRLLYLPKASGTGDVVRADPRATRLVRAVLLDARSVVRSQTMGTRAVRRTTRLHWDLLIEVFGDEGEIARALDTVRLDQDEELASVIELADRYLSGWRPSDWQDD
jgi:energy-coupling factor transporter ATP-binding protein EcfA2